MKLRDCNAHATFYPLRDDGLPAVLLSGQLASRPNSQLSIGDCFTDQNINGRESVLLNPDNTQIRKIKEGDIVEIANAQGRCLAGASVTDDIAPGSAFLWTGAWFDPDGAALQARCRPGNLSVLTAGRRSSALTQSPAAHGIQVEITCFDGPLPPITVHASPTFVPRRAGIA